MADTKLTDLTEELTALDDADLLYVADATGPSSKKIRADNLRNTILDGEITATEGFLRKSGAGAYEAIKSNLSATVDPTVNEDSGDGYGVGSLWINTTGDKVFQCVDASVGAAVWKELSAGAGGGISNVVEDTTPQLGGQLDVNGQALGDGTLELLTFSETGSAVNHFNITNAATGNAPAFGAVGDDANVSLNLTSKGTGSVQANGSIVRTAGKETIWVPAAAMRPTVSNGCASLTDVETTAGRPDMQVLDFDATADEHAQFSVAFPKSWNEGTVTFKAFWTTSGAVTTGVAIALQGVAVSDNETLDVAYGTAVVVTDDAQGAAEELYVTAESSAVTIAGTPAESDAAFFRVFRDVSDANDDMTQDMRLLGIQLFYTTNAGNDA